MSIATSTEWNLRRKQQRALRELRQLLRHNVMRGTVVEAVRRCGRKNCGCARDTSKMHPRWLLSVNLAGRTRTAHLDKVHLDAVKRATANYRRLWQLLDALTEANIRLLAFDPPGP